MVYVHLLGSTWCYTDQLVHHCQQGSSMSVHTYPSMVTWPHHLLQSLKGSGALLGWISWALYDVLGLPNFHNPHHFEQQIWSCMLFVAPTLPRCMVNLHRSHQILLPFNIKKLPQIFMGMFITYVHIKFHIPFMSVEAMRLTYFSYLHSILSYGIIFWGEFST